MTWRQVAAILITVVGIVAPLAIGSKLFGLEARMDLTGPDVLRQAMFLGGSLLACFAAGIASSLLYRERNTPPLMEVMRLALDSVESSHSHKPAKKAA